MRESSITKLTTTVISAAAERKQCLLLGETCLAAYPRRWVQQCGMTSNIMYVMTCCRAHKEHRILHILSEATMATLDLRLYEYASRSFCTPSLLKIFEDVPLLELCTFYLLACQVTVTAGDSGFRGCVPCYPCEVCPALLIPFVC